MSIEYLYILATAALVLSSVTAPLFSKKVSTAGWINLFFITAAGVMFSCVAFSAVTGRGLHGIIELGPLRVPYLVDGLSGFFILIISFMAFMCSVYSIRYMEHYSGLKTGGYYASFPLFVLGMTGIVTVDDLSLGFTAAWQFMTISSYYLVRFEKTVEIKKKSLKYLVYMELAWALVVTAPFFAGNCAAGASIHEIAVSLKSQGHVMVFLFYALMLAGFGFKAGIFPLGQLWLPDAHSMAPSPVSALLSGVMIKTGLYGLIRTFFWMLPETGVPGLSGMFWGTVIASLGTVTLFVGTVQCVKQNDSKRLLAYSSIGQMGYMVLAVGASLMLFNSGGMMRTIALLAFLGALYHVLNHAVFKGLLFLSAGSVLYSTGERDFDRLGGIMKILPLSAVVAAVASLSISGLPPFSGFASKWTIITSSIISGQYLPVLMAFGIIALFTSTITLSAYVKFFGMTYAARQSAVISQKDVIKKVPMLMMLPKALMALLCMALGLFPFYYISFFHSILTHSTGSSLDAIVRNFVPGSMLAGQFSGISFSIPLAGSSLSSAVMPVFILIIIAAAGLIAVLIMKSGTSEKVTVGPWLCGYQEPDEQNRYRSADLFAAFNRFFRWTGANTDIKREEIQR